MTLNCNKRFMRVKDKKLTWIMCYPEDQIFNICEEPFTIDEVIDLTKIYKERYNVNLSCEERLVPYETTLAYLITITFDNEADEAAFILAVS